MLEVIQKLVDMEVRLRHLRMWLETCGDDCKDLEMSELSALLENLDEVSKRVISRIARRTLGL